MSLPKPYYDEDGAINADHQWGCPECVRELRAKLAQAERERDEWKKALHSLTPGGSEYANDAVNCVMVVRQMRRQQHEAILKFKHQRDDLERDLAAAKVEIDNLKGNIIAFHNQEQQLWAAIVEACDMILNIDHDHDHAAALKRQWGG